MSKKIPLAKPFVHGNEWAYVKECIDTGWISSVGKYIDRFEDALAQMTGSRHVIVVSSGTAALHIALKLVGVKEGDEVIVPTVTFIAPVNALHYCGASAIFMDCDEYYNVDVAKVIKFIREETVFQDGYTYNKKTNKCVRAIMPVHVLGSAADLAPLLDLCRERNIKIAEDATESLGTIYTQGPLAGKHTGTIGDAGCLSFNGNKIITTGSGGAILTNNDDYAAQARYWIAQAKDDDIQYIHNDVGYNYRLSNIQAALGLAQLEGLHEAILRKRTNYHLYKEHLQGIEGLRLADTPAYADNNYWMYGLQVDRGQFGCGKDELIQFLADHEIEARSLWYLNHKQLPYARCQNYQIERAYTLWEQTLNIPCSVDLTVDQIKEVCACIKKIQDELALKA